MKLNLTEKQIEEIDAFINPKEIRNTEKMRKELESVPEDQLRSLRRTLGVNHEIFGKSIDKLEKGEVIPCVNCCRKEPKVFVPTYFFYNHAHQMSQIKIEREKLSPSPLLPEQKQPEELVVEEVQQKLIP